MNTLFMAIAIFLLTIPEQATPGISTIVQESARVTDADRRAAPKYDYSETDLESDGSKKTYAVHMLFGSPYQELTAIDGKPLSKDKREEQGHKLQREIAKREQESSAERDRRVEEYQKEQNRDRRFMHEFVHAFDFKLVAESRIGNRQVYVVQATPRPGYHATDKASQVLTGMRGRLWIDKQTYQWVKVEAEVIHPVSIDGFVAQVEPGTRFELEKMPVANGIWLPKHYTMTARADILFFIPHGKHEDTTYFNYHKAPQDPKETAGIHLPRGVGGFSRPTCKTAWRAA